MTSTPSTILRLELMGSGDQAGTWGTTTNTNLGTLLEGAIAGIANVSVTSNKQALTALNYTTDQSRMAMLVLTTTTTAIFEIYAPPAPVTKQYIIYNTTAYDATIYNSTILGNTIAAGAGVSIPANKVMSVWTNGSSFFKSITALSLASDVTGTLPVANGGTGATTAATARTNLGLAIGTDIPSTTGTGATGTWAIGISGNAATATTATTAQNTRLGGGSVSTNIANGTLALNANTTGAQNTASGYEALSANTDGSNSVAVGYGSLRSSTSFNGQNTAIGSTALYSNASGSYNTAVGYTSLFSNTTGNHNVGIGLRSLYDNAGGGYNTAVGNYSLRFNTVGDRNVAVGYNALYLATTTSYGSVAVGYNALYNNTGSVNVAVGESALYGTTSGAGNCGLGYQTLTSNTIGNYNTALGYSALSTGTSYSNATGVGYQTQVTGSSQVQLGDSSTTTYYYAISARSDLRDKTDVRDTSLGLDFIMRLRPVDYRWDMRDDYRPIATGVNPPTPPTPLSETASEAEKEAYEQAVATFKTANNEWIEKNKLANIQHDGSKKRKRMHHGLIAQDVKRVMDELGIDFGGYQDHSVNGGDDVLTVGYTELIAPLIKAVQQLTARVQELEQK